MWQPIGAASMRNCTPVLQAQGFGSVLHTATIHLAVAMQHGRLFLWLPTRHRPVPEDRQWWKEHVHVNDARLNDMVCSALTLTLTQTAAPHSPHDGPR